MLKLVIKKDDLLVDKITIPPDLLAFTVGSDQGNDIVLNGGNISIFHLQFEKQDEQYYVRDLLSQTGTFLNGQRVNDRTRLENYDELGIGQYKIGISLLPGTSHSALDKDYDFTFHHTKRIEDKFAHVPALKTLNSWLFEEGGPDNDLSADQIIGPENNLSEPANGEQNGNSGRLDFENGNGGHPKNSLVRQGDFYVEVDGLIDGSLDLDFESDPAPVPEEEETTEPEPDPIDEEPDKSEQPAYYLLGIYGAYLGSKFKLRFPQTKLGRDRKRNDIVINKTSKGKTDYSVSRRHTTLRYKDDCFYVTDKRSKSGTYVNHKKVEPYEEVPLTPGDELELVSNEKSHIFRLVPEGQWDFGFPKKAGGWPVRYRLPFLRLLSILLILASCYLFAVSFSTHRQLSKQPKPLTALAQTWYTNRAAAGQVGGYPTALADINGDDYTDLFFIDSDGQLACLDGKEKNLIWVNSEFQTEPRYGITLCDLNNDGKMDVTVVSKDTRIRAIDGPWGIEIWKSPVLSGPLTGPPAIGDFNGDRLQDIVAANLQKTIYLGFSNPNDMNWTEMQSTEPLYSVPTAADLTGNGVDNILIGSELGNILLIDGLQNKIIGKINVNEELNKALGSFEIGNKMTIPVAIGDITGDKIDDFVIYTTLGNLIALNGQNLERLWFDKNGQPGHHLVDSESSFTPALSLGDLDGDRILDIVCVTPDGQIKALKGTGQGRDRKMLLWTYPDTQAGHFAGIPSLADFNKNGTMDAVAFTEDGRIYIFEGATGEILWQQSNSGGPILSTPLIADLDNDNFLDVLVSRSSGTIDKFTTNRLCMNAALFWGQIFGNHQHTGHSPYTEPKSSFYVIYMLLSVAIIGSVSGIYFYFRKKRELLGNGQ